MFRKGTQSLNRMGKCKSQKKLNTNYIMLLKTRVDTEFLSQAAIRSGACAHLIIYANEVPKALKQYLIMTIK